MNFGATPQMCDDDRLYLGFENSNKAFSCCATLEKEIKSWKPRIQNSNIFTQDLFLLHKGYTLLVTPFGNCSILYFKRENRKNIESAVFTLERCLEDDWLLYE